MGKELKENITIREVLPKDAGRIVQLHKEADRFFEEKNIDEETLMLIMQRKDFRILVCELDDKIRGFSGMLYHPRVKRAELGPICVERKYRGRGIGSLLFEKTVKFLRNAGIKRVTVKVKEENEEGLAFFKEKGFAEEGFFRDYTYQGGNVVQLVKFI